MCTHTNRDSLARISASPRSRPSSISSMFVSLCDAAVPFVVCAEWIFMLSVLQGLYKVQRGPVTCPPALLHLHRAKHGFKGPKAGQGLNCGMQNRFKGAIWNTLGNTKTKCCRCCWAIVSTCGQNYALLFGPFCSSDHVYLL